MEENNTSIFAQAKIEYTQQLIDVLTPNMFDGIKSIYDESKVVFSTQTNQSILNLFRTFLEKVPEWNNELVEVETERIIKESRCDWLDDLVTAVFISHTKILTSIGPNMKNTRVNLTIPKTINFVHKCYINLAREIWKNPYLYDESVSGSEYQKNMRTIELIIKENIENTIRKLLPVKEILKDHLDNFDNNEAENKRREENISLQAALIEEIRSLKNNLTPSENGLSENEDNDENEDNAENNDSPKNMDNETAEIIQTLLEKSKEDDEELIKEQLEESENKESFENKIEIEESLPSNNGYESPDEEKVKQECENIEINTIQDITDDTNDNTVEEIAYDNAEIIDPNKTNSELMDNFKNNLQVLESTPVEEKVSDILSPRKETEQIMDDPLFNNEIKPEGDNGTENEIETGEISEQDIINKDKSDLEAESVEPVKVEKLGIEEEEDINNPDLKGIVMGKSPKKNKDIKEITIIKKDEDIPKPEVNVNQEENNGLGSIGEDSEAKVEPIETFNEEETNKKLEEIITVPVNDDDTETVDNFISDISSLMEKKGVEVDKEVKSYTLFDDAAENE